MSVSHNSRVLELEIGLLLQLCENIASARSQMVYMLAVSGQWQDLVELKCDPINYNDHSAFADDYLVTSVMQKNPRLPLNIDRRSVAIEKFRTSERQCAEANERISGFLEGNISVTTDIRSAIHHARETIREILGPLTRSDLGFAERNMRFGPGATTSLSGVVTQGTKYSRRKIDATPRVASFRTFCFPEYWKQSVPEISLTQCSKLTTVPKNAKTDRVICIEPDLNIYVQLGIGALLRKKLSVFGLDLGTQDHNQMLSKRAHLDDLCTMDLSSASDTISREAVWLLLDYNWCDLLHFARVDKTRVDEEEISLQKWSSMGNGYTFELETIIFYGIVIGCLKALDQPYRFEDVLAYGDDLIFPNVARELVQRTLEFLGFSVNREKTFGKGLFHESCGTDWFGGNNVRPIFFRSLHHDFPTICYIYANNLRRWANRRKGGLSCDVRLLPAWLRCLSAVKAQERHLIPEGFGDVGFSADFDRATPSIYRLVSRQEDRVSPRDRVYNGWSGYTFRYREVKAKMFETSQLGCLTAFLSGKVTEFSLGREALRGRFLPPRTRRGHVLTWPNLGPWL